MSTVCCGNYSPFNILGSVEHSCFWVFIFCVIHDSLLPVLSDGKLHLLFPPNHNI